MTDKGLGYFIQKRRCVKNYPYNQVVGIIKTGKEGNYELHTEKAWGFS